MVATLRSVLRIGSSALLVLLTACETTGGHKVLVTSPSAEPVTLTAKVVKPSGDGSFPALVLLHGCNGNDTWGEQWAQRLAGWGYASIRANSFRPRGERSNCLGAKVSHSSGNRVTRGVRVQDAHAMKAYLKTIPFVDGSRIGVMGMSDGGGTSIYAVENKLIKDELRADPFKVAVAYYPPCPRHVYRVDAPLLVMIGDEDDWTYAFRCENMEQAESLGMPLSLEVYSGAPHGFDIFGYEPSGGSNRYGYRSGYHDASARDSFRRTRAFLDEHLR